MKAIDKLFDKFGKNNPDKKEAAKKEAQQVIVNAAMKLNYIMTPGSTVIVNIKDGSVTKGGKKTDIPGGAIIITKPAASESISVEPGHVDADEVKK